MIPCVATAVLDTLEYDKQMQSEKYKIACHHPAEREHREVTRHFFAMVLNSALFFILFFPNLFLCDSIDTRLYRQIHLRWQSEFLEPVMEGASFVGDDPTVLAINLGVLTFGDSTARASGKLATVALMGAVITTTLLKGVVNRDRPQGDFSRWDSSFPSGHSTAAFALATSYGLENKKLLIPLTAGAVLIGLSRIYLGWHYPSDVLAGAAVGIGWGVAVHSQKRFVLKLGF